MSDEIDNLEGFGLAQLKQEPTKEEWAKFTSAFSKAWAEMAKVRADKDREIFLAVVAQASRMLERGKTMEDVVLMIKETYEPDDWDIPEDRD